MRIKRLKANGSLTGSVVKNSLGAFLVKGCSLLLSVLMLPAYIRYFDNEAILGIWYTLLSVVNWVMWFDLGMGQGLRNQLPKALEQNDWDSAKKYTSTTYATMLIVAVILQIFGMVAIHRIDWLSILNISVDTISNAAIAKCVTIIYTGIIIQMVLKIITFILYAIQKSAIVNILSFISNLIIYTTICILPSADIETNLYRMSWVNVAAINLPLVFTTVYIFGKELRRMIPTFRAVCGSMIKEVLNIGLTLLWLQLAFMMVTAINEFLITRLVSPEAVVEYQIYQKIFKTAAMMVTLALTPIWSAVTKAQAQQNYRWIRKVYLIFCSLAVLCFIGELAVIPFLQWGINIWLGSDAIEVSIVSAIICACSSAVFVMHNVNTTVGNGMSCFRIQVIWMTFAAIAYIPVATVLERMFDGWIWIVVANIIVMLPYEIHAVIFTVRYLGKQVYLTDNAAEKHSD